MSFAAIGASIAALFSAAGAGTAAAGAGAAGAGAAGLGAGGLMAAPALTAGIGSLAGAGAGAAGAAGAGAGLGSVLSGGMQGLMGASLLKNLISSGGQPGMMPIGGRSMQTPSLSMSTVGNQLAAPPYVVPDATQLGVRGIGGPSGRQPSLDELLALLMQSSGRRMG